MSNLKQKFLPLIAFIPTLPTIIFGLYSILVWGSVGGMGGGFAVIFGTLIIVACIIPACLFLAFTRGIFRHSPPVKRAKCLALSIIFHIISFAVTWMSFQNTPIPTILASFGLVSLFVISVFALTIHKKAISPISATVGTTIISLDKHKNGATALIPILSFLPTLPYVGLYLGGTIFLLLNNLSDIFLYIWLHTHYYRQENFLPLLLYTIAFLIPSIPLFICMHDAYKEPVKKHISLLLVSIVLHIAYFTYIFRDRVGSYSSQFLKSHVATIGILCVISFIIIVLMIAKKYTRASTNQKGGKE